MNGVFTLTDLHIPLIVAPMAGGPSTPALVAAAAHAGATGFLAGGYKTVDAMAAEIADTRTRASGPFGVNLFVPHAADRVTDLTAYQAELAAEFTRYSVPLPETDPADTDAWAEKIELLLADPVPVVSFTFGLPDAHTIDRFHAVGTHVTATVTDTDEASAAVAVGADSLCVQGPDGGGHRGTHAVDKAPDARDLDQLLRDVRGGTDVPLIAAGGIGTAADIARLLTIGAQAIQMGTLLLRTPESGASPAYKQALASGAFTAATVTRAFSGRWARGLTNRFIRDHDGHAPASYPQVHQLTKPLRAAAAAIGDPDGLALFAGSGFTHSREAPAAEVLESLWREARTLRP